MERLKTWANEGSVETLIVAGVDLQGRLYGKRFAVGPFLGDFAGGVNTCDCNYGWDVDRMLIPGMAFTGWHTGYGDMSLKPDWNTLRRYPWFDKTALVLCDTCRESGDAISIAPRTILRGQLAKAAAMGYTVMAAPEVEFFLFRETLESSRAKGYENLEPMSRYISDYCVFRSSMDEHIVGLFRKNLTAAGVEVECSKAEWGHGQMEVNLVYAEALEMADRHVIFKNGIREMAALNGLQASFMAKWHSDHSSSGCHVHMSLWKDSENAFFDPAGDRRKSKAMRHFMGGMMTLARDLQLFYAPNINSYKRYRDGSFAPVTITWGGDNRTVSFRSCGHGKSTRVENRLPGADANAHLAYAAMLAAGLYGMENEIEPTTPYIEGNAYDCKDAPTIHRDLEHAANGLDQSLIARKLLGDDVVDHYVALARWEIQECRAWVSDWERRRYFELI